MYFTTDSLLPENQQPLMITVAPFGPQLLPTDYPEDIAVSSKDQVQKAVDCYNAGATVLHVHVRDPKTGHISKNFAEYCDFIGMLRQAVPRMILQVGGSISFTPEPRQEADDEQGNRRDGGDQLPLRQPVRVQLVSSSTSVGRATSLACRAYISPATSSCIALNPPYAMATAAAAPMKAPIFRSAPSGKSTVR